MDRPTPSLIPLIFCGLLIAPAGGHGTTLERQSLSAYSKAICNDGQPAALYSSGTGSSNWLIFLDGGGGCVTQEECDIRWQLTQTGQSANNMKGGAALPLRVKKDGIFDRTQAANPVKDWNFVYLYYCSSDEWIGGGGTLASGEEANGAPDSYVFQGANVIDAAIHFLRTTGIPNGEGGRSQLRNRGDVRLLFAGTSAGGKGVMNNVLRLEAALPAVDKFYAVDAYFHGLDAGLAASDDTAESLAKGVYAPKLSSACKGLACLRPATVHAVFQARGLRVLYAFSERDQTIGREAVGSCFGVAYPYQTDCTGAPGPGAALQKSRVKAAATPQGQHAGWHPDSVRHSMLANGNFFYGLNGAPTISGKRYVDAVADLLAGTPSLSVAP